MAKVISISRGNKNVLPNDRYVNALYSLLMELLWSDLKLSSTETRSVKRRIACELLKPGGIRTNFIDFADRIILAAAYFKTMPHPRDFFGSNQPFGYDATYVPHLFCRLYSARQPHGPAAMQLGICKRYWMDVLKQSKTALVRVVKNHSLFRSDLVLFIVVSTATLSIND